MFYTLRRKPSALPTYFDNEGLNDNVDHDLVQNN